jgi:predicted negative regulator of RcsB-dependent stress response
MVKQKVTRKELLKSPDEFLTFSGRAIAFFTAHRRKLSYVGIGICAVAILYLAGLSYLNYINRKGQEAYNQAYTTAMKEIKPGVVSEEIQKLQGLFEKVKEDHGLSRAARLAPVQVAYLKFFQKQYDEAIGLYTQFLDKTSSDPRYADLARLALASCYEAKGDLDAAIKTLTPLREGPKELFTEVALLELSRLYRLAKQPEKAGEAVKVVEEKFPNSPLLPVAKATL